MQTHRDFAGTLPWTIHRPSLDWPLPFLHHGLNPSGIMLAETPGSALVGVIPGIFVMSRDSLSSVVTRRLRLPHIFFFPRYTPNLLHLHPERPAHLEAIITNLHFSQ